MPTIFLNLTDLDNLIRTMEKTWDTSSVEMLRNESVRERIPEDVLLRWETYIRQRIHLRDASEQLRADYLAGVPRTTRSQRALTSKDQVDLAA